jgi:hypothetical protein
MRSEVAYYTPAGTIDRSGGYVAISVPWEPPSGDTFATIEPGGLVTLNEEGLYLVTFAVQLTVGWADYVSAPSGLVDIGAVLMPPTVGGTT